MSRTKTILAQAYHKKQIAVVTLIRKPQFTILGIQRGHFFFDHYVCHCLFCTSNFDVLVSHIQSDCKVKNIRPKWDAKQKKLIRSLTRRYAS